MTALLLACLFPLSQGYLIGCSSTNCAQSNSCGTICTGQTVNCVDHPDGDNTQCKVYCYLEGCDGTTINCAPGIPCRILPGSDRAARNAQINGQYASGLSISTGDYANYQLYFATITCPDNGDCSVSCTDGGSGSYNCAYMDVHAENSNKLVIACRNTNDVCKNIDIWCPDVNTPNSCIINGIPDTASVRNANIRSKHGFNTFQVNYAENQQSIGTMRCLDGYTTSCSIDKSTQNQCQNGPTPCDIVTTTNPTVDPTPAPTDNPTADPTIDPTADPTADPTFDPTIDPTFDPTTDPTVDPTSDPTVDPTSDPTIDPTFDPTIDPTFDPTADPTSDPTIDPTFDPTADPTIDPTIVPTYYPTADPTAQPTANPTIEHFIKPNAPKLHKKLYRHAIGYLSPNIVLLGGESTPLAVRQQMQQYDTVNDIMIDNGTWFLPNGIFGVGQFYTQILNDVYIVASGGTSIYVYHLDTNILETFWANIPKATEHFACVASNEVDNILYVVGGYQGGMKITLNDVQILDISTMQWISNVPKLNIVRSSLTCNVHLTTKRLYAIGGFISPTVDDILNGNSHSTYLNSIEYLDISDMSNIQQQSWQYNPHNLSYAASGSRSIVHVDYVYVIGGSYADIVLKYIPRLQIIDTKTGVVSLGAEFNPSAGLGGTACVIIEGTIYAFGGASSNDLLDSWQYYDTGIPTPSPTSSPTEHPTTNPSANPTNDPTMQPTAVPTDSTRYPTSDPSKPPSTDPTNVPTVHPTFNPSLDPTSNPTFNPISRQPTIYPTNNPTIDPTIQPTSNPSTNPTFNPSVNPTTDPSKDPTFNPTTYPSETPTTNPIITPSGNHKTNSTVNSTSPTTRSYKKLHFFGHYNDDKEFVINYLSLSEYAHVMIEAIISSIESVTLQPFYYDQANSNQFAAWNRAGILDFVICNVFDNNLRNLHIECPSYFEFSSDSNEDEYISVGVFNITADDKLSQYENWMIGIFESNNFKVAFTENMNDKLSKSASNGRRLLEYDSFRAIKINIMDAKNYSISTTENEDTFQDANDNNSGTVTTVIIIVCILVVVIVVVIFAINYIKRNKQKINTQNEIEGIYYKSKVEMQQNNKEEKSICDVKIDDLGNNESKDGDHEIIKEINETIIKHNNDNKANDVNEEDIINAINLTDVNDEHVLGTMNETVIGENNDDNIIQQGVI